MKLKSAVAALIAVSVITTPVAFAQGNSNHGDRGDARNDRNDRHDNRDFGRRHNEEMRRGRGAGPNHQYYRGDRLPAEYRHRNYVVSDWRGHRLSAPPRGYQWVQNGNDYLLVAIASGLIAQLMLGN